MKSSQRFRPIVTANASDSIVLQMIARENPLVSVVIPAYNASKTITRALDSVLQQSYAPMEIIIIDDASTDNTLQLLKKYEDEGIRIIASLSNNGVSEARNIGIHAAGGKYIAFLDSDDEWLPGKLAMQVEVMERNPSWVLSACDDQEVTPTGQELPPPPDPRPPVPGPESWRTLLAYSFIQTSGIIVRREEILALNGFDPDLPPAEDQDMWIRLALAGDVGYLRERLVRKFNTPGSLMSRHPLAEVDVLLPMIRKHIRQQRHRLTKQEVRAILGQRYGNAGRNLYSGGYYWHGARLLLNAAFLGFRPIENLILLVAASPLARRFRGWLCG